MKGIRLYVYMNDLLLSSNVCFMLCYDTVLLGYVEQVETVGYYWP